jgi:hypothetical protein
MTTDRIETPQSNARPRDADTPNAAPTRKTFVEPTISSPVDVPKPPPSSRRWTAAAQASAGTTSDPGSTDGERRSSKVARAIGRATRLLARDPRDAA